MSEARLANAPWLTSGPASRALALLNGNGEEARVAGGAVRNALLGQPVADIDIATTALPEEVIRRAEAAGFKAVPTGIEHGTVTVVAGGQPFEVTTLREDIETDGRRAKVAFGRDWKRDAERRDFTINALYARRRRHGPRPVGGLADIEARRVRFIGDAGGAHPRGLSAHPALLPLLRLVRRGRAARSRRASLPASRRAPAWRALARTRAHGNDQAHGG